MSSKFGRIARLLVKDRVIEYPDLEMDFTIDFNTDSDGNVGSIEVYNLSNQTIKLLKKGQPFKFEAGYDDNIDILTLGTIESSTTKFEQGDKLTKVIINDNTDAWVNTKVNQTWRLKIWASDIVTWICKQVPLEIGKIKVAKDVEYFKGKTFSCTAKRALEELARDTNSKLHISKGRIYFLPPGGASRKVLTLSKDTGLIASPQRIDQEDGERWKVQSLLNYRFEADGILDIESETITINGLYRIDKGTHMGDWTTEMEVVPYST